MRIAVVGLGGVGGYIAAKLVKAGVDVIGFARGEHLEVIRERGLTIIEDEVKWNTRIDTREEDDLDGYFDGYFDFVLFCVKSYDLKESYEHIKSHIDENTGLLSFSNGVGNANVLRSLSTAIVLDACIYILSHIDRAGYIRKKGKVFAAVFGGEEKSVVALREVFEQADLRVKTPEDIETAIWKKYIFISAFATLTSYYNNTIGYICEHHYENAKALLEEIAAVAKSKGVDISLEVQKSLTTASKLPYDGTTSMYLDFKNKKRDELKSISGYIVQEGQKNSVATPLMKEMYEELLKRHID